MRKIERWGKAALITGAVLTIPVLLVWPKAWAREMAWVEVGGCYYSQLQGSYDDCGTYGWTQGEKQEERWGRLRSFRRVSIRQMLLNDSYRIVIEADRERGATLEEVDVRTGDAERIGYGRWARIDNVLIRLR